MRNQRVTIGVGILVALSAVVAGFVIFASGETQAKRPSETPPAAVRDGALVIGPASGATYAVQVREDLGSSQARAFDLASRDFLRIEAAQGTVQVTYQPQPGGSGEYAAQALAAYQDALASDTPRKVVALREDLYDKQPTPAPGSDDGALPQVSVDGKPVTGSDGTTMADALQELVVKGQR